MHDYCISLAFTYQFEKIEKRSQTISDGIPFQLTGAGGVPSQSGYSYNVCVCVQFFCNILAGTVPS